MDYSVKKSKIKKINKLDNYDDEYVYDISMKNSIRNWFVANGITVKNTDSAYFSAYPVFEETGMDWTVDNVIELYDTAAESMNSSFPQFMVDAFSTTIENGAIIEAGREVVSQKGLFIKKKRYALLCNDIEGRRFDLDDSDGKLKAMGIELKRSDTPAAIQDFLSNVLMMALTGSTEDEIMNFVKDFRAEFRSWPGWKKGSPKRVNGLTTKVAAEKKHGTVAMAGHQRASMNWNKLRELYNDKYSLEIQDGGKVIVCKLKSNPLKYTSVAYPVDQEQLPDWFLELPFDEEAMEDLLIDKKIANIFGVLKWRLRRKEEDTTFGQLFQ